MYNALRSKNGEKMNDVVCGFFSRALQLQHRVKCRHIKWNAQRLISFLPTTLSLSPQGNLMLMVTTDLMRTSALAEKLRKRVGA